MEKDVDPLRVRPSSTHRSLRHFEVEGEEEELRERMVGMVRAEANLRGVLPSQIGRNPTRGTRSAKHVARRDIGQGTLNVLWVPNRASALRELRDPLEK